MITIIIKIIKINSLINDNTCRTFLDWVLSVLSSTSIQIVDEIKIEFVVKKSFFNDDSISMKIEQIFLSNYTIYLEKIQSTSEQKTVVLFVFKLNKINLVITPDKNNFGWKLWEFTPECRRLFDKRN